MDSPFGWQLYLYVGLISRCVENIIHQLWQRLRNLAKSRTLKTIQFTHQMNENEFRSIFFLLFKMLFIRIEIAKAASKHALTRVVVRDSIMLRASGSAHQLIICSNCCRFSRLLNFNFVTYLKIKINLFRRERKRGAQRIQTKRGAAITLAPNVSLFSRCGPGPAKVHINHSDEAEFGQPNDLITKINNILPIIIINVSPISLPVFFGFGGDREAKWFGYPKIITFMAFH